METLEVLLREGYKAIKFVPGRGHCGLTRMFFTSALCYGLDEKSYVGRYCYHTMSEARKALDEWDGSGDPTGNWIKHKGKTEYSNPNYNKDEV